MYNVPNMSLAFLLCQKDAGSRLLSVNESYSTTNTQEQPYLFIQLPYQPYNRFLTDFQPDL